MAFKHIKHLRQIFQNAVKSVHPMELLSNANNYYLQPVEAAGRVTIRIQGKTVDITGKRCHVVGFGKAVLGMAVQLERALGLHLADGLISIPIGTLAQFANVPEMQLGARTRIEVIECAANNQPDAVAMRAAQRIKQLAASMTSDDVLFVLISGGGSALLPLPRAPLNLQDKMELVRELANHGASIKEMNVVRIALSDIKGGQLAAAARNAFAVISFVVCDIVGNPIDLVASGPTSATLQREGAAMEVLKKYNMLETLSPVVREVIEHIPPSKDIEPGPNNTVYVVGDNRIAAVNAAREAEKLGYNPFIASTTMEGEVQTLVAMYRELLQNICLFRNCQIDKNALRQRFPFDLSIFEQFVETLQVCKKTCKPLLLILAGEPTIKVTGSGRGGRNQELALRMSLEFYANAELAHMTFLSAGTDGIDGPTRAAGAIGSASVIEAHLKRPAQTLATAKSALANNDSYTFYHELDNALFHIIIGHTGTNVMDIQLVVVP